MLEKSQFLPPLSSNLDLPKINKITIVNPQDFKKPVGATIEGTNTPITWAQSSDNSITIMLEEGVTIDQSIKISVNFDENDDPETTTQSDDPETTTQSESSGRMIVAHLFAILAVILLR